MASTIVPYPTRGGCVTKDTTITVDATNPLYNYAADRDCDIVIYETVSYTSSIYFNINANASASAMAFKKQSSGNVNIYPQIRDVINCVEHNVHFEGGVFLSASQYGDSNAIAIRLSLDKGEFLSIFYGMTSGTGNSYRIIQIDR